MDFSLTTLYVLPNGSVAPLNFKRENLKPTQFGIFNSRYKAVTTAAEVGTSPYIVFGQGRIENIPGLTHKYSDKISKNSKVEWYKTTASPTAKNQITYAGFDGVDNLKTIKAGPDEQFSLTVRLRSLYIDNAFAYGLTRTVTVTTPCGEDCGADCTEVDPRIVAELFAEGVNKEPLLSKFVTATVVYDCSVAPAAASVVNIVVYTASKVDEGDAFALAAVQNAYPNDDVKLLSHNEATGSSTYEIQRKSGDPVPSTLVGLTWAATDTAVKFNRSLVLTVATANAAATLTELQTLYAATGTVTQVEAANGNVKYKLVQASSTSHEDASFATVAQYAQVQDFDGMEWTVEKAALTGSGCVAGVKIEGKSLDKYGNPCDPIAFPHEWDKLTFEVFSYKGAPTTQDSLTFDRCDNIPVTTVQKSTYATGSGEEIFMLEKRYHSEQTTGVAKHIYHNATWNGGFVRYSDPNAFYDTYVIEFKSPDFAAYSNQSLTTERVIIAVPTGTGGTIETFLNAYFGAASFNAGIL